MNSSPKAILILDPLKDLAYLGLTTHALNVFSRLPHGEFVSYGFFDNPSFERGSLRRLSSSHGLRGVIQEVREMRKLRPDIFYGTGTITELVYFLFRPRRTKYVVAWHGPYDKQWLLDIGNHSFRAHVSYWIASYLLARADLFACDTEFIAASLRKSFPRKKIVVTLEGVDADLYAPAKRDPQWLAKKFSITEGRRVFVFIGHLIRRKRPEIFVELARRFPDELFLMVGREGLYKATDVAEWKKRAPNLAWAPSTIGREEMPKLLASAQALIFPSLEEPFGFAVIEAMASGLAVIATRSGSLPELIEDGKEGFLIDHNGTEIAAYETVVRKVIQGGPAIDQVRKHAREKAEKTFNWDGVAKRYEGAFMELGRPQ